MTALDEAVARHPATGTDGATASSSALSSPPALGAFDFICAVCLLTFDEPWCSCCGQRIGLNSDRPSHPILGGTVRGPEGNHHA